MKFEDLTIGMKASVSRTITSEDVLTYAKLTGDFNPIHVDEEAAKKSVFGRRIAHGMLSASLFTAILGETLPGPGTIYLGQDAKFIAPVFVGETVTAQVEVAELRADKHIVKLSTTVTKEDGVVAVTGLAVVKLP